MGSQSWMELNPITIASLRAGQSGIPNASLLQTITFCYRSLKYHVFIVNNNNNKIKIQKKKKLSRKRIPWASPRTDNCLENT